MPEPIPPGLAFGIDLPLDGATVAAKQVEVAGWGMHGGRPLLAAAVTLSAPGWARTVLASPYERPDVCETFGLAGGEYGWVAVFDLAGAPEDAVVDARATLWPEPDVAPVTLAPRPFRLGARSELAEAPAGRPLQREEDEILGSFELQGDEDEIGCDDLLWIRGWAGVHGSTVDEVEIFVDGKSVGCARLGLYRPDVMQHTGLVEHLLSGFEHYVDLASLPPVPATIDVHAIFRAGGRTRLVEAQRLGLAPARRLAVVDRRRSPEALVERTRRVLEKVPAGVLSPVGRPAGNLDLLVVTHDLGYGGGQLWLSELLDKAGAGRRFPCTVVSPAPGPLSDDLERRGILVHVRGGIAMGDIEAYEGQVLELAAWSRLLGHNAALVNTMGAFIGADVAQRLGIPCVWAIHESWPPEEYWKTCLPGADVDRHVVAAARRALSAAQAVVFEAEATRSLYEGAIGDGAGVVVPYGIDLASIDCYLAGTSKAAARRQLDLPHTARVVLMMGTIEPRKAQTVLTQAFARIAAEHADALLVLVGDQFTAYSEALKRYVEESGLGKRVRIVPVVKDIYPWYRAADVFVCDSDVESLPRSVLEVMAFGVPVLATDVFGLPELIEDGRTGWLFRPRSVSDAAEALQRALSADVSTLEDIGRKGAAVVRQRHDSRGYANTILGLLRSLQQSTGRSARDVVSTLTSCDSSPTSVAR
jgi:glycosyltransferase involved in cell wall biosynthesis